MEPISFDEFKSRLENESMSDLRSMAKDTGLDLSPNLQRDTLLKRLFDASDFPKIESTPVERPEKPPANPPTATPGVVYQVALRAEKPRWRGGCLWQVGITEMPVKKMSKAMLRALDGDKDFKAQKVEIK